MVGDDTMSDRFGVQKISAFGSFGEFTIGDGPSTVRAKYILTKIKPGGKGFWECELASQMKPWREVFNVKELDFDELLQRDIDDSRVAHDLIPYLLGTSGYRAKFFPPILAVIAPQKEDGTGIEQYYPAPTEDGDLKVNYGDLFEVERLKLNNERAPMVELRYNRQRTAFIIVDGQHRAMAVLALHRQLNTDWSDNPYASYYSHIKVNAEHVKNIELPVCIMYFPDLHEDHSLAKAQDIDLSFTCREIFLVVNRSAKRVSEARQLLLDDEDIAARLMRNTLSTLKTRDNEKDGLAQINSISYGDSDTEIGHREVISGQLEYSSAIALHKIHKATSFGTTEAFTLETDSSDVSDGRSTQNPNRSPKILIGTSVQNYPLLPHNSGKSLPANDLKKIVEKLGNLTDFALVNLLDKFRPFKIHNEELQNLENRLLDVNARSDNVSRKARALIFEGGGVQNVFDSHFERLKKELENSQTVSDHLEEQIKFCQRVNKRVDENVEEFQRHRACKFFSINHDRFYQESSNNQDNQTTLLNKTRSLFKSLATQAFQLGYTMAVFTIVEILIDEQPNSHHFSYERRFMLVQFVTEVYLAALNQYFSPTEKTKHHTLTGYITESRASVFDANSPGLRGLLAMSVSEINEKQWRFFRYAILEIIHSPFSWDAAGKKMKQINNEWALEWYKVAIPKFVDGIIDGREKYVEDAIDASIKGREYESLKMQTEFEAKGAGKSPEQINHAIEGLKNTRKADAEKNAQNHLKSSLKIVEEKEDMINRLKNGLE